MRHHILVKWKEGCKPGLEPIRELFQETLAIPGVESVELHPNVIDRPNRYDLLILLCMEKSALEAYDGSEAHHRWKEVYGGMIEKKAIAAKAPPSKRENRSIQRGSRFFLRSFFQALPDFFPVQRFFFQ